MFDVLDTGDVTASVHPGDFPEDASDRPALGQLLVDRGHITEEQLQAGLAQHQWTGRPLGQVLVALGFVSETTIAQARQHCGIIEAECGFSTGFDASLASGPVGGGVPPVSAPGITPAAAVIPLPVEPAPEPPAPAVPSPAIDVTTSLRIEALERELAEANQERVEAGARVAQLEAEIRANTLRLKASDQLAGIANERIAALEREIESARAAVSPTGPAVEERVAEMSTQVEGLETQLERAHASLEAARARYDTLDLELAASRRHATELGDEKARLTGELETAHGEAATARQELAAAREELTIATASQRDAAGLRDENVRLIAELDGARTETETAQNELAAARNELTLAAASQRAASALRQENERLAGELDATRRELEAAKKELAATRDELALRHSELASTVESFRAAYARLQYLESAATPAPRSAPAQQRPHAPDGRRAAFAWQS